MWTVVYHGLRTPIDSTISCRRSRASASA
jgi:hypothetical protein